MSNENPQLEKVRCFISHAHEDREFVVNKLVPRLKERDVEPKGDWLLVPGEQYESRLRELNLAAHAFVFVMSPDSIVSPPCRNELSVAVEHNKQILPIAHRDHGDDNLLDSALRTTHWTVIRKGEVDEFERGVDDLITAMKTDFALIDMHSRLVVAADSWKGHERNRSYLWTGDSLKTAEQWLATVSAQPDKQPQPTELQGEFIFESQRARSRRQRNQLGIAVGVTLALIVLSAIALAQRGNAITNATLARNNEEEAVRQKAKAEDNLVEATKQKGIAEVNFKDAESQRKKAEENLLEAQRQQAEAEKQRKIAEENLAEAERQEAEAIRRKKEAEENFAEAQRQRDEATKQRQEAEDRGRKLQKSYSTADYRAGNQLLLNDDYAGGVAHLARALMTNPANASAADRLFTLLSTRDQPRLLNRLKLSNRVKDFDISSDGESVIAVSESGAVVLWKGDGPKVTFDLNGLRAQTVRFIPKSKSLFVISTTGPVLIFNTDNPKASFVHSLSSPVSVYAWSQDREKLAVACEDDSLFIVPLTGDGQAKPQALPPIKAVVSLSFINYDLGLVVLSRSGLHTWDDLKELQSKSTPMAEEFEEIDLSAVANDGTYSYTELQGGGGTETPYIDVTIKGSDKAKWKSAQYDNARAIDLDFNPAATFLAVTLNTEIVHVLRQSGTALTLRHDGLTSSGVHPTKELLYTASSNGTVNLWSSSRGKLACAPLRHGQPVTEAKFSEDGQYLAARTEDGSINIWDIHQRAFTAEKNDVDGIDVNPKLPWGEKRDRKGQFVLSGAKKQDDEAVWQLRNAANEKVIRTYRHPLTDEAKDPEAVSQRHPGVYPSPGAAISENGKIVVTIIGNNAARVWRTDSDNHVFELKTNEPSTSYANTIYLTPSGDKALMGYQLVSDSELPRFFYQLFSLVDGRALTKPLFLRPDQALMDVSRDLERVIIAEEETAQVYGGREFHAIGQEVSHRDRIGEAVFLEDERSFCTISYDASARIWDTETGFPLTDILRFERTGKWNWGAVAGAENKHDYSLPTPLWLDDQRRLVIPYETDPGDQIWDVSLRANADDAKILVDLLTLVHGQRFNDSGVVEFVSQPTMAELSQHFAKESGNKSDVGKLLKWFLTPRAMRKATPYAQK